MYSGIEKHWWMQEEKRRRELEALILEFRQKLQYIDSTAGGSICICIDGEPDCRGLEEYYDEFFKITKDRI